MVPLELVLDLVVLSSIGFEPLGNYVAGHALWLSFLLLEVGHQVFRGFVVNALRARVLSCF